MAPTNHATRLRRRRRIYALHAQGLPNTLIALDLGIHEATVRFYLSKLKAREKLVSTVVSTVVSSTHEENPKIIQLRKEASA